MALVVEDGTIVAGANTYGDDAGFQAYAASRGLTIPSTATEREVLLTLAMDYIESFAAEYSGVRTTETQGTQFPRAGAYLYGDLLADDVIPTILVNAQYQAAFEAQETDLMPSTVEAPVRQETVGPITTIYGVSAADPWAGPQFPKVMAWLRPLFEGGGSFGVPVCRV